MSRVMAALLGCWLSLCFFNSGTGMAMATERAHYAGILLASNDAEDEQTGLGALSGTKKAPETPVKEPARQVPVEPFEDPSDEAGTEPEEPSADAAKINKADESGAEPDTKALKKIPEKSTSTPAAKAEEEQPEQKTKGHVNEGPSAKEAEMTAPALPIRKPRKPVFHKKKESEKARVKPVLPRSARDKKLCKALQMCRNEFVKCKSKIKHPDQSGPWIIAKEVCGGYYKTCVEKDFQPGEWFMTRWFYFQELNCGE